MNALATRLGKRQEPFRSLLGRVAERSNTAVLKLDLVQFRRVGIGL